LDVRISEEISKGELKRFAEEQLKDKEPKYPDSENEMWSIRKITLR